MALEGPVLLEALEEVAHLEALGGAILLHRPLVGPPSYPHCMPW